MKDTVSWGLPILRAALLISVILGACTQTGTAIPEPTPIVQLSIPATSAKPKESIQLRVVVLPILDSLPMYVAQKERLFEKHNVRVELVPVASAPERDQLVSAGQADGMINEAISTMLYNREKVQVITVRYARAATAETPLFRILAAPRSNITTPSDLKGNPIGISQGTVIEYLTERLLQAEGLEPQEIKTVAVPKIPDRLALLSSGEIKAAMLPEPAASLAQQQGAIPVLDDSQHPEFSFSTITMRKAFIEQNPEAVRGFLAAIEEAVALINADPSRYAGLLVEQKVVPAPLAGSFKVPTFITKGVPSQAQWEDNLAWAKEKGLLSVDVPYQGSVDGSFLP